MSSLKSPTGRKVLEGLEELALGKLVYHGSPTPAAQIEHSQPRVLNPKTKRWVKDGKPALCATDNYDTAIFNAVIHRTLADQNDWFGVEHRHQPEGAKLIFLVTRHLYEQARAHGTCGYVHVFNKIDFVHYRGHEYRAYIDISPCYSIPVRFSDIARYLTIID